MSYKATNSYALFSDNLKGEQVIELSVDNNLDRSGANEPVLSENMIPVYYDETNDVWRKADSNNADDRYKWYNYDEKMWANSVTVSSSSSETTLTLDDGSTKSCSGSTCVRNDYISAPLGTVMPMEDILTMQVWIPRYKYKVWNYNKDGTVTSEPQEIEINFEEETSSSGEITCTDSISGIAGSTSENCTIKETGVDCTDSSCNGRTYTHPAFLFGEEELTGFWIGKFEVSSDIGCTAANYSAVKAGCNLTTIRPQVKPNVTSWRGAMVGTYENNMLAMNDSGNIYGLATTDDTHMIKNIEWGAVTYLSHSKYGINEELTINSNSDYITGCGPQASESTSSGVACNTYNTVLGQSASTSGNVYGIYDMSGGSVEYVMGNIISLDGKIMISGISDSDNNYSGYSGVLYSSGNYVSYVGIYEYPDSEYFDKYSYGTTYNDSIARKRSKLGDGIKEFLSWYDDDNYVVSNQYAWFLRGGHINDDIGAGLFYSNSGHGCTLNNRSSRFIISQ